MDGVMDAAVVGRDGSHSRNLCLAIVRSGHINPSDVARYIHGKFCSGDIFKERIALEISAKQVEFVDEIPRTTNGKIRRSELRRDLEL